MQEKRLQPLADETTMMRLLRQPVRKTLLLADKKVRRLLRLPLASDRTLRHVRSSRELSSERPSHGEWDGGLHTMR